MIQQAVLDYLLNAGWQLALIGACAFALSRLLKLPPAQTCRLWLAAFALAVLAPVLAMASHGVAPSRVVPSGAAWGNIAIPPPLGLALGAAFWAFLAIAALRLLISCIVSLRLVKASRPVTLPDEMRAGLEDFCRQNGREPPPILGCARIASPVVAGLRKPCVLVPPDVLAQDSEALRAALLHELAHVLRRDHGVNLVVELFALPLVWHPALHGIKAMIRLTREQSCDAIAAARIGCRHRYAQSLLALARQAIAPRTGAGASVALFGDGDLHSRIALLAADAPRRRLAGLPAVAVVATFLLLGAVVTGVHVSALTPAQVREAASHPVVRTAAAQAAMLKPERMAMDKSQPRKPHSHAHARSDIRIAARKVTAPQIALGAGSDGVPDLLLQDQIQKYRTIFP